MYTNVTGCPVISKCKVGVNGMISLDGNPIVMKDAAINTTKDGSMKILAPQGNPCSLVIQNNRVSDLTLQISGPNVAAELVKIDMTKQSQIQKTYAYTSFTIFKLKPADDFMVMYIGSIDPKGDGDLIFSWKNDQVFGLDSILNMKLLYSQTKYDYVAYLKKTGVYDLVQESLKQTAVNRPLDPIRFIAAYLQERAEDYENVGLNHGNGPSGNANLQPSDVSKGSSDNSKVKKNNNPVEQESVYGVDQPVKLGQPRNKEPEKRKILDQNKFKTNRQLVHIQDPTELDNNSKTSLLQVLTEQIVISSKIVNDYYEPAKQNLGDIVFKLIQGQNVILTDRNFPATNSQEFELLLQEISKQYQNVIEVELNSKSVSDVEYKVVHNSQLELVGESTHLLPISSEQKDLIGKYLVTMIEEMNLLKMIYNPKFIAEIKEEIFIINGEELTQYVAIHEKSDKNLDNIPEIWKFKTEPVLENYKPEKAAFYLFQALSIVNYLHENNVYHGSIRPLAFEIYKDQSMKISDLQYGIKMKDDSSKNLDREIYQLRGLPEFCSDDTKRRFQAGSKFARKHLIEVDRFSLISTFEQVIDDLKIFIHGNKQADQLLFMQIYQDLKKESIEKTYIKWDKYFQNHTEFFFTLQDQMLAEHKFFAVPTIFTYSEYQDLIKFELNMVEQKLETGNDNQSEKSSHFTASKLNQDNKSALNQKLFIASWMKYGQYRNDKLKTFHINQRIFQYLHLCYEFPGFYAVRMNSKIEAMTELMPVFKKTLHKVPQVQQEFVLYFYGLTMSCSDQEIIKEAIKFVKQCGRESYVMQALAYLYFRMAKFFFYRDENDQLICYYPYSDNPPAEQYSNLALKAMELVDGNQDFEKEIYLFLVQYYNIWGYTQKVRDFFKQINMKFFFQSLRQIQDLDLIVAYGNHLTLLGKFDEAKSYLMKAGGIFGKVFGKSFNRYLDFSWELGRNLLIQGNADFMQHLMKIKVDSKYYLEYIELLKPLNQIDKLVEAIHDFNPPFDHVEPFIWQYLLAKYYQIEYQTELNEEEIIYQLNNYITYDQLNPEKNETDQQQDPNFPTVYREFINYVCDNTLIFQALTAYLGVKEDDRLYIYGQQYRIDFLQKTFQQSLNQEEPAEE
ncbi:UNKNOWN [Stylonychia lemnae]|uniref:Protein kinase domain-containing protein n=1 Tax=Stylonychia lemnae TaxID=5949 RepID=A0A078AF47_STYLE|nr:UNKNOWN [Stylonychia lemnae]|eukprot:CDW80147.1 UNKNOWN [Stylonychia lemnae]